MRRQWRLRPVHGGVFAPSYGSPVTGGLTCRECGYHVCACPKEEQEKRTAKKKARQLSKLVNFGYLSPVALGAPSGTIKHPSKPWTLAFYRGWSAGGHRKVDIYINGEIVGRWYVRTDASSQSVGFFERYRVPFYGGLRQFLEDCFDPAFSGFGHNPPGEKDEQPSRDDAEASCGY